jgi:DNA-directed RNA polymerase specialized sigma subunit
MGSAELARTNAELMRNYIRNYQQVRGLVPYVVGRYTIVAARELGPEDVFSAGMVALTTAVDSGELLMGAPLPG